ncbi:MAG: acetyltransferase [Dehalococcoidia bacterium DG_18]|nr:MAG: acetyltransferase [Dehalococcoidia bacterium DG_18]
MKAEKAHIGDIPQIHKLVNSFAEKGEMLPRALSELYENIRDMFVIREGEQVVACAALHVFWSDLAEIRAVAVVDEMQDQGAGAMLVQACLEEAIGLGIETIFCLTYKPDFFERFGFCQVDKMDLPRKVWAECLRCPKFPDCDEVALVYNLERSG